MNKEELTLSFEINEENKKVLDFLKEESRKTYWYRIENEDGEHLDVVDKEKYDNLQQENKQLKDNWNKLKEHIQECLNEALENDVYDRTSYEQGIIAGLESSLFKLEELENGDSNE